MQARVAAASSQRSENDGLSPPSAGRCRCPVRCPVPQRKDEFAFHTAFCLCVYMCVGGCVCAELYVVHTSEALRMRVARPLPGLLVLGMGGASWRGEMDPPGATSDAWPVGSLSLCPKSIAANPLNELATWAYHEVMAGDSVTVSAVAPLLLR
jgi:hypothetical protein